MAEAMDEAGNVATDENQQMDSPEEEMWLDEGEVEALEGSGTEDSQEGLPAEWAGAGEQPTEAAWADVTGDVPSADELTAESWGADGREGEGTTAAEGAGWEEHTSYEANHENAAEEDPGAAPATGGGHGLIYEALVGAGVEEHIDEAGAALAEREGVVEEAGEEEEEEWLLEDSLSDDGAAEQAPEEAAGDACAPQPKQRAVVNDQGDSTEDLLKLLGEEDAEAKTETLAAGAWRRARNTTDDDDDEVVWKLDYINETKAKLAGRSGAAGGGAGRGGGGGVLVTRVTAAPAARQTGKRGRDDDNGNSSEPKGKTVKRSGVINPSLTNRRRLSERRQSAGAAAHAHAKSNGDGVKGLQASNGAGSGEGSREESVSESSEQTDEEVDAAGRRSGGGSGVGGGGGGKRVHFAEPLADSEDLLDELSDEISSEEDVPPEYEFGLDVRAERAGELLPLLGRSAAALLQMESDRLQSAMRKLAREGSGVRELLRGSGRERRELRAHLADLDRQLAAA